MSVNKAILLGRVGKDPEVRTVGESKVATFSLATSERYKDSKTGEWKENTEWHSIVCWRNTAEIAEKYITKGMNLYVEGKLRTRSWDDKDGNKRYVTEIIADVVHLLDKRQETQTAAPAPAPQARPKSTPLPTKDDDPSDDLPF